MIKKYTELDPRTELEQQVSKDLRSALKKRDVTIKHHGTASGHAPATAPADITMDWGVGKNKHRFLVEVAQRSDESEFTPIVQHLDDAVASMPGTHISVLYAGKSTSARMVRFIRNENQRRSNAKLAGRIVFMRLNDLQEMLAHWKSFPAKQYPIEPLGTLPDQWLKFTSDLVAYQMFQETVFPDWQEKAQELSQEQMRNIAIRQERLRTDIVKLENKLRERGYTGIRAHKILIFLFFTALYEDKRGARSRATVEGLMQYRNALPKADLNDPEFKDYTVHHLITKEIAQDPDVKTSGMMNHYEKVELPDDFVVEEVLPIFDSYPLSEGGMDFIGAVFEALARRAEKDNRIGQFFTPETAVVATCRMVKPRPTDTVLDPACGTGRFLIHAMDMMLTRAGEVKTSQRDVVERQIKHERLLGTDIDGWVATIAKMNMYIHGDGKSNIRAMDGLALSTFEAFAPVRKGRMLDNVDVVVTNPPLGDWNFVNTAKDLARKGLLGKLSATPGTSEYSDEIDRLAKHWTNERLSVIPHICKEKALAEKYQSSIANWQTKLLQAKTAGDAKAQKRAAQILQQTQDKLGEIQQKIGAGDVTYESAGEYAKGGALFLSAILGYLNPARDPNAPEEWRGGIVGIVMDEAVLNTAEYAIARQFITTNFFIKAIVSLPRNAFEFLAKTTAKTSILILIKKPDPDVVQREPVYYAKATTVGYTSTGVDTVNDLVSINDDYDAWQQVVMDSYRGHKLDEKALHALTFPHKSMPL